MNEEKEGKKESHGDEVVSHQPPVADDDQLSKIEDQLKKAQDTSST
jgi:hypothetical protein